MTYIVPATSMASKDPRTPPFATVKFQPMYSPTSTIPTPRAHTWKGLRVFTKLADSCSDMPISLFFLKPYWHPVRPSPSIRKPGDI
jgi:hypothetical protein